MNTELISKDCVFYDLIVNFSYNNNDYLSSILINDYKDYLLYSKKINKKKLKKYDLVLGTYVTDKRFYKYVLNDYAKLDYFIDDTRIYLLNKYNEYHHLKNNYVSRWI